jgi:hypothetical protein
MEAISSSELDYLYAVKQMNVLKLEDETVHSVDQVSARNKK